MKVGQSQRLSMAVDRLWETMDEEYGLFPDLAIDACLARARRDELTTATPRLLSAIVDARSDAPITTPQEAAEIVALIGQGNWDSARRAAIEETLDAWWLETLGRDRDEHSEAFPPSVVLGVLVGYDAPLIRWFDPWLDALDGPAAGHLAEVILAGPNGMSGPAWEGKDDQRAQVFGWARTETVINGITLVGGVHLDADVLGRVLDRLI